MRPHVVAMVVTEDLPVFEMAAPYEVFGIKRPDLADPWYELRVCALRPGIVHAASGVLVQAPYGLAALETADTVLVAACPAAVRNDPPQAVLTALRNAHHHGARVASICTGAYLLAAAGLLDGRGATTHWIHAADFARRYPLVRVDPSVLYVDDGDLLTSAGTGAGIDLCLHLVRLDHGAAVANAVARRMVVPPHRDGGQAQYVPIAPAPPETAGLGAVMEWARQRLDQPITVADLARQAAMSPRTFARHFHDTTGLAPLQWLIQQRIRAAQELLETSTAPVEWIARRAGFGSAANFRTRFARATGLSPQAYRGVFHQAVKPAVGSPRAVAPPKAPSVTTRRP